MSKKKKTLDDIFNDDEFGILDSKPTNSNIKSEDERLIESFQEINTFFEKNDREPEATNVTEFKLLSRLKGLRQDAKKVEILKEYDIHNLLNTKEEVKSVADIISDDDLGILDTEETLSIFELKNVPSSTERSETDFVARRKPMKEKDFLKYEATFKEVHKDLREGNRQLVKFKEDNLQEGAYYVLDGVLMLLEQTNIETTEQTLKSGKRIRKDGRTRIVFENGTESNMLYRSLAKALYINGQVITHSSKTDGYVLQTNVNLVQEEDIETGWIYILKSKSTDPEIVAINDLYKIGYSTTPVEERISNASKEPTYLMADVHLITTYRCYNINPQKFEQLVQRFFAKACLNIDIFDSNDKRYMPREWFVVPLGIIEKVVELIISEEIIDYSYDPKNQALKRE